METPPPATHLGMDAAASADDSREAVGGEGDVAQQHPGVDRPVVHSLLSLLDQCIPARIDVTRIS